MSAQKHGTGTGIYVTTIGRSVTVETTGETTV